MTNGLALRPATEDDYDFLYELHRAAMMESIEATWGWDELWQKAYFQEHFDPARRRIVLLDGREIGVISIETRDSALYLALIEIDPGCQRQGIGTALLRQFKERALSAGSAATLHVLKANESARRLYEREGFKIIGEEEHKYLMQLNPDPDDLAQQK